MFRNHVPPNFEGVRRRNSVWGLHRYAGTAGTRRESRAPEHSLLPAYARGARRNMSDFVLSDFEDEDAGYCSDSDDEVGGVVIESSPSPRCRSESRSSV